MKTTDKVNALAAKNEKTTTLKEKAEAAKTKAKDAAKRPTAKTAETDQKTLAKGKAVHKK